MQRLKDRIALITGSSSGIGAGVARAFAREGAHVVLNYPDENSYLEIDSVKAAINDFGRRALVVCADVSEELQVKGMIEKVVAEFGRIDILVNNAGHADRGAMIQDMEVEVFDRMVAVHLKGTFLCCKHTIPYMYRHNYGKIINVASQFALNSSTPLFCHYNAAKAGIISLTRTLSLEVGSRKVNVNCIAMGATLTPMVDQVPPEKPEKVLANQTQGRFGDVNEDIVPSFVFLASEDSSFYVGQTLSPNGGDVFN